jgi:alcohol dehydrogenase class IV
VGYWFTNPLVKILLPMGNSTAIKGLNTQFSMPKLIMGANVFPAGKARGGAAAHQFAQLCEAKRAFIVTDAFGRQFAKRVAHSLESVAFSVEIWAEALPEAPLENIEVCAAAMGKFASDLIVAVGGGSVIDGAKAAWIRYARPDIEDLGNVTLFTPLGLRKKAILVAVPTTSGTGSECTSVAVVHDTAAERKVPVANGEIMPDFAVLCPEFTLTMPPKLTAGTGLDALSHAMDAVATPAANEITDSLALKAIQMVFTYLPRAYAHGEDREARHRMLLASSLAGVAFGQSGAALTHSFGHSVGSIFHVHHGLAVGMFIPYAYQFYRAVSDKFLAVCDALEIPTGSGEARFQGLMSKLKDLFHRLDVPLSLDRIGISAEELERRMETLVQYTCEDIDTLFSPRPMTAEQCARIFRCAHVGRDVDF